MKQSLFIIVSFIIALMLTIFPLPSALAWYRPAWVLLVLMYWLITVPDRVGIVSSFFVGLLLDLLTGSLLGLHALLFTCLGFAFLKWHLVIRGLSTLQKIFLVLCIETVILIIQYNIAVHAHLFVQTWRYWMPILTSGFCWLWVSALLGHFYQRASNSSYR